MRPLLIKRQQALLRSPIINLTADGSSLCYTSNTLYACGNNRWGQLGLGHTNYCSTFTPLIPPPGAIQHVAAGAYHTVVLTDQGLYGCGLNRYGQLGLGQGHNTKPCKTFTPLIPPPGAIQHVVAGDAHTLVVLTDQGLYGCGKNRYGQLGLGHTKPCTTFTKLISPPGTIQHVVASANHTLVLTDQGLYACGYNREGQLGLGHTDHRTTLTLLKSMPAELRQLQALYRQLGKLIMFIEAKEPRSQQLDLNSNNQFSLK